jgi:hypothetical protein
MNRRWIGNKPQRPTLGCIKTEPSSPNNAVYYGLSARVVLARSEVANDRVLPHHAPLGSAALDRRWSAWVVLLAGLPVAFFFPTTSDVGASVVLLATSLVFVVLGVARGQLRRPAGLPLQAAGMLGFGAIALAALYVDTVLGAYLVAAALLGHAVWDAFHYLRDRVVARSYAEFCGILDLVLGAAILLFLA